MGRHSLLSPAPKGFGLPGFSDSAGVVERKQFPSKPRVDFPGVGSDVQAVTLQSYDCTKGFGPARHDDNRVHISNQAL